MWSTSINKWRAKFSSVMVRKDIYIFVEKCLFTLIFFFNQTLILLYLAVESIILFFEKCVFHQWRLWLQTTPVGFISSGGSIKRWHPKSKDPVNMLHLHPPISLQQHFLSNEQEMNVGKHFTYENFKFYIRFQPQNYLEN